MRYTFVLLVMVLVACDGGNGSSDKDADTTAEVSDTTTTETSTETETVEDTTQCIPTVHPGPCTSYPCGSPTDQPVTYGYDNRDRVISETSERGCVAYTWLEGEIAYKDVDYDCDEVIDYGEENIYLNGVLLRTGWVEPEDWKGWYVYDRSSDGSVIVSECRCTWDTIPCPWDVGCTATTRIEYVYNDCDQLVEELHYKPPTSTEVAYRKILTYEQGNVARMTEEPGNPGCWEYTYECW